MAQVKLDTQGLADGAVIAAGRSIHTALVSLPLSGLAALKEEAKLESAIRLQPDGGRRACEPPSLAYGLAVMRPSARSARARCPKLEPLLEHDNHQSS